MKNFKTKKPFLSNQTKLILQGWIFISPHLRKMFRHSCCSLQIAAYIFLDLQLNQQEMFSFVHENLLSNPSKDNFNPQAFQSPRQMQISLKTQQISDGGNEIQTPNFQFFQHHLRNESLFDAYHNQFSSKSSQVNKLISTFEELGLDVEYLQDSDAQHELNSIAESLNQQQQLKKTCSLQEKICENREHKITVSIPDQVKVLQKYKQQLKQIKNSCIIVRSELSSLFQSQAKFQRGIENIIENAIATFESYLANFMKSYQAYKKKCELQCSSNLYLQAFRKDNEEIQSIFVGKQQKIKKLIKENEYLTLQNQKLHSQLSKIAAENKKFKQINNDYEEMLNCHPKYQKKIYDLQLQNNELTDKVDSLQWNMKQIQRQLSHLNYENKTCKHQLEQKYQKIFQQTAEKLTKRIQAQTYYKMKHQYPLNIKCSQTKGDYLNNYDQQYLKPLDAKSINRSNSNYQANQSTKINRSKDLTALRSTNLTQSLPPKIVYSPQPNKLSGFFGFDSPSQSSSNYQEKLIKSNERQAERILNDIKMMKASKVYTNFTSSSRLLDYRRQSMARLNNTKT